MIEKYLCENWDEPPEKMEFVKRFDRLVQELHGSLEQVVQKKGSSEAVKNEDFHQHLSNIHLLAPALPNVTLNYKICMEFGLPADPIEYVDFDRTEKNPEIYDSQEKGQARQLFREALSAARLAYVLSPNSLPALQRFYQHLPAVLREAEFTSKKDRYTWKASNPQQIQALAKKIEERIGKPHLLVGVAHGSIGPGMVLANQFSCDMHLIRYSSFMREDTKPIISSSDIEFFASYGSDSVVLFDEDVTEGVTLKRFAKSLAPYFDHHYTATVIQHHLAPFQPDFVGGTFSDRY